VADPWHIHFFQRPAHEDASRVVPTSAFLDTLADKLVAEIQAVLEAVAAAPPPAFSGGGKWEAMHDDMAGLYEVRVHGGGANHRLFCILDRNADDLGGPSIICLGGLSKPTRSPADPRDYRAVKQYAAEFAKYRTVLR
jgi:Txe/YoeB family toxin of Txe-Axe toxin-antitoxin module